MELSLVTFALMALAVVVTPGPTVLLALSNGTRFGFGRAGYGILGAAVSDLVLITAAALGLGVLLSTSALLFSVVKWIGVAYLVWIGIQMLRSSGGLGEGPSTERLRAEPLAIFRKSLLVAVSNPKGYLFFAAFLPQFVDPSAPLIGQYLVLALVFVAVDIAAMAAYAGLGARAMQMLSGRGATGIDRTCGGLLVAMGAGLALVRRSPA